MGWRERRTPTTTRQAFVALNTTLAECPTPDIRIPAQRAKFTARVAYYLNYAASALLCSRDMSRCVTVPRSLLPFAPRRVRILWRARPVLPPRQMPRKGDV